MAVSKKTKKGKSRIMKRLFWLVLFLLAIPIGLNLHMIITTHHLLYQDIQKVPRAKYGLILGTSPLMSDGRPNLFYTYRIQAAHALYKERKVEKLFISGHHGSIHYSEPRRMKADLIELGVPQSAIITDGAGYRTLDSIVRAFEVFEIKDFIIVSQRDHNYRATFIAQAKGHQVNAYCARMPKSPGALKVASREFLARVKAYLDLYIWHTEPQSLEASPF